MVGAAAGAQLLALTPRQEMSAGISPAVLETLPTMEGKNFEFAQTELRARVGETVALRLENSDPEAHSFDVDKLNVHTPIPVGETGVALFKPTEPGVCQGRFIFGSPAEEPW